MGIRELLQKVQMEGSVDERELRDDVLDENPLGWILFMV